jgi:1-acyl-sn-glycerol-3-phosphate acyltransferase
MRNAWLAVRSLILWVLSGLHFFIVGAILFFIGVFVDPRKNDWPQRLFFRNILRIAGVKFEVRRAPGFDPDRTSIFICNHVNIFDPFVVYSAIPQFVRGFELESHFKVPVYGWMMGRFGNVAVPDKPSRESLQIMAQRAKAALDSGISLIGFAEGSRTRDGHVHEFKKGIFNLAHQFGVPVVPMSIVGSYQFFRTGHWMLHPGKIIVYLHDTIDVSQVERTEVAALARRVQEIVSEPVEQSLKEESRENRSGDLRQAGSGK